MNQAQLRAEISKLVSKYAELSMATIFLLLAKPLFPPLKKLARLNYKI